MCKCTPRNSDPHYQSHTWQVRINPRAEPSDSEPESDSIPDLEERSPPGSPPELSYTDTESESDSGPETNDTPATDNDPTNPIQNALRQAEELRVLLQHLLFLERRPNQH